MSRLPFPRSNVTYPSVNHIHLQVSRLNMRQAIQLNDLSFSLVPPCDFRAASEVGPLETLPPWHATICYELRLVICGTRSKFTEILNLPRLQEVSLSEF